MDHWFRTKGQLILTILLMFLFVFFIVNNGNILIDGRNERKYLKRKYNEL